MLDTPASEIPDSPLGLSKVQKVALRESQLYVYVSPGPRTTGPSESLARMSTDTGDSSPSVAVTLPVRLYIENEATKKASTRKIPSCILGLDWKFFLIKVIYCNLRLF